MKWLALPFVALAAAIVAVWLLARSRHGHAVVLTRGRSPGFLRLVAVLLVLLAPPDRELAADEPAGGTPVAPAIPGEWPTGVGEQEVARWRRSVRWTSEWTAFKRAYTRAMLPGAGPAVADAGELAKRVPTDTGALLMADLTARAGGVELPHHAASRLLRALDDAEEKGLYDPWYAAYLWRASARVPRDARRIELYLRLRQHLRLALTFARAHVAARAPAFEPRAWMSKAGPTRPQLEREEAAVRDTLAAARRLYATQDAGPWDRECRVGCRLAAGSAGLTLPSSHTRLVVAGESLRLGRLDMVMAGNAGAVLEHAHYGRFAVGPDRIVTAWELGEGADDAARARIDTDIAAALAGDEPAAARLEGAFALAHGAVRAALAAHAEAPGAPRLRTIAALFDDAVIDPR